ncbi:MAG: DPP IV N-terminal domain-containing protein [Balneolaceae bacterium]|nr:DPP IV N-terminal domain-containing protein [Balneolaceae bacterium]
MTKLQSLSSFVIFIFLFLFSSGLVFSQQNREMEEAYQRAEQMLSWNLSGKVFNSSVNPEQIDEDHFWYVLNTRSGNEYFLVNVPDQNKEHAFDHQRLAEAINDSAVSETDPKNLALRNLSFHDQLRSVQFEKEQKIWECSLVHYECEILESVQNPPSHSVVSPDGKKAVYISEYNLWVQNLETGDQTQLTTDGEKNYGYGTDNHGWRRSDRPILKWSPDSRKIATFRQDDRDVGKMTLWRTRVGRPEADIWPYALPGDSIVTKLERVVIDVTEPSVTFLEMDRDHHRSSNCCGLIRDGYWTDIEWSRDSSTLGFVSTSRDYKNVNLRMADPETGNVTEIYHEHDEIFFESNLTSRGIPNWRILHDTDEFIWFTRKSNWGHLYLHNLETGELKNQITDGDWNVIDILHIDKENREIFFTGVGREEGRDPYFIHLYRVNFDGSGLTLLTPEDANHSVTLSKDAAWFVDTFSTYESAPETVLRDRDGNLLMELDEADIEDLLETGWQKPKPITVKARDGETDLYGIMLLPSDFDENKQYPIINSIYPGPQSGSLGSRSFSAVQRGQAHALAELGFVVVAIDAFGSGPMRSRDFHTYYSGDMADNGLPDQIAGMEQLAEQYSFIDLDRAGIYGHSGGGFATAAAMFQYPEFFKVGVSSAGNHDNRGYTYYWGEKFQGLLERDEFSDNYENQAVQNMAGNLEGKLLISYGTMDTNVHPSMTLLVIDELIRQNKDFDLIVMPNRGHGYANEPYHVRRTWDYFVKHLVGETPPFEYQFNR